MKKAINGWAFGDASIEEMFRLAKDGGYQGLELVFNEEGPVSPLATDADVAHVRELSARYEVAITSVACGLFWTWSLSSSDATVRRRAVEIGQSLVRYAALVGADTVLVIPGAVGIPWNPDAEIVRYDLALERARDGIRALLPLAEETGVRLGIENVWNKMLLSPTEMRDFIDQFGSSHVVAYFDVANVLPFGYPEHWLHILGARVAKVHAKGFAMPGGMLAPSGFVDLLAGEVNWPAVMTTLAEIGYNDALIAEVSPYRHYPRAVLYTTSVALDFVLGRRP